jgi:hypothetical protein
MRRRDGPVGVLRLSIPAVLAALIACGCSRSFPVLIKVDPEVRTPKAVDIVWILNEESSGPLQNRILKFFDSEAGMTEYFRNERQKLGQEVNIRFYHYQPESGEPALAKEGPLWVTSRQDGLNLYGPYREKIPPGATWGYLFIGYEKDAGAKGLPFLVYPFFKVNPEKAVKGLSVEIRKGDFRVISYDEEQEALIEKARQEREREKRSAEKPPESDDSARKASS